jgi:hypothetical protein
MVIKTAQAESSTNTPSPAQAKERVPELGNGEPLAVENVPVFVS